VHRLAVAEAELDRIRSEREHREAFTLQQQMQGAVQHTHKTPETVARELAEDIRVYFEKPLLIQPWAIQTALANRLLELEATPRHGSRGAVLCADLGIGKTYITLLLIWLANCLAVRQGAGRFGRPTLVVAPKGVYHQWMEESARFFAPELMTFDSVDSTADAWQRFDPVRTVKCIDFVVVSYDTLKECIGSPLFAVPWHRIVADEGSVLVNDATQVFHACAEIQAERRLFISGTPVPNTRAKEMNAILQFLRCPLRVHALDRPPLPTPVDDARSWMLEEEEDDEDEPAGRDPAGVLAEWQQAVDSFWVHGEPSDATPLPEAVLQLRAHQTTLCWVELTPEERVYYDRLEAEASAPGERIHRLRHITRLRQACQSTTLIARTAAKNHRRDLDIPAVPDPPLSSKYRAMLQYITENVRTDEKALVVSGTLGPLEEFQWWLRQSGITAEMLTGDMTVQQRAQLTARIADPDSSDPRVGLLPFKLCIGLDGLQGNPARPGGGASHILFSDGHWNSTTESQSLARILRPGQSRQVYSVKFVTLNTIEEFVLHHNRKKQALAQLVHVNVKR